MELVCTAPPPVQTERNALSAGPCVSGSATECDGNSGTLRRSASETGKRSSMSASQRAALSKSEPSQGRWMCGFALVVVEVGE